MTGNIFQQLNLLMVNYHQFVYWFVHDRLLPFLGSPWLYIAVFLISIVFSIFHPIGFDGLIYIVMFSLFSLSFERQLALLFLLFVGCIFNFIGCCVGIIISGWYVRYLRRNHWILYLRHKNFFNDLTPVQLRYLGTKRNIFLVNVCLGFSLPFLFIWAFLQNFSEREQLRLFTIAYVIKTFMAVGFILLCVVCFADSLLVHLLSFWIPVLFSLALLYVFFASIWDATRYTLQIIGWHEDE